MSLFPIVVTATFVLPNDDPDLAVGDVQFDLSVAIIDTADGIVVPQRTVKCSIDNTGRIAVPLLPTDVAGLRPPNAQYFVTIGVAGAVLRQGWLTVPHAPVGSRTVTDLVTVAGSNVITSATAAFTGADVGKYVSGSNLPVNPAAQMVIAGVTNSTTATIAGTASASASGGTLIIGASADLTALLALAG